MLEIIYQDENLVAINKPHGLLVHRSKIADKVDTFALQLLRDQLGQKVFPIHRLDRKTSGVLLFALNKDSDKFLQMQFREQKVEKTYLAIVRGFIDDNGTIDYPLRKESGQLQEAVTHFESLEHLEIPLPFGQHKTSRYSLVELHPETGRMHQLRKHMAHISHPIIGDRPHGCNKQNKLFKEKWGMDKMMLHAKFLSIADPVSGNRIELEAKPSEEFSRTMKILQGDYDHQR